MDGIQFIDAGVSDWATDKELPIEVNEADIGWLPGPVGGTAGRPMPTFTGRPMGPRDAAVKAQASARQIVASCHLSRAYKEKVVHCTRQHQQLWASVRDGQDGVERAFDAESLKGQHVELWFAVAVRVAKLNDAIPAKRLWEEGHHCYDAEVAAACSFIHWQWMNRHISFGDARPEHEAVSEEDGSDGESEGEGLSAESGAAADRHRTRRAGSDISRRQAGKAYSCGQHAAWDDFIFADRHWGGIRVRYKAAVHTGRPCDGLNDCRTKYFVYWEEHGWVREDSSGAASAPLDTAGTAGGGSAGAVASSGAGGRAGQRGSTSRGTGSRGGRGGSSSRARGSGRGHGRGRGRGRGRNSVDGDGGQGGGSGAGVAIAAEDDEQDDPDDSSSAAASSLTLRLRRAYRSLTPHVGHCLWLDRGQSSLAACQQCVDDGYDVTALMQTNRIGLPRRYLAELKQSMACPRGCKHGSHSTGCLRWSWTVLHKGRWELEIWSDGSHLVIALSSCTSATRCVHLARQVGNTTWRVVCPMGVGCYNIFGRNATDGGDQQRNRLSLSSRRRTRVGPKGALFDAEIGAFVNGSIIAELKRKAKLTLWEFADEYTSDVLASVTMRQRTPARMAAAAAAQHDASSSGTRAEKCAHTPIDFLAECARAKRAAKHAGSSSMPVTGKRGRACCETDCDPGEPKRPRIFCPGCAREREGCSGWYHAACYWRRHRACLK